LYNYKHPNPKQSFELKKIATYNEQDDTGISQNPERNSQSASQTISKSSESEIHNRDMQVLTNLEIGMLKRKTKSNAHRF
jgi:hypothetical protein